MNYITELPPGEMERYDCSPFCTARISELAEGRKREIVRTETKTNDPEINQVEHHCGLGPEYSGCAVLNAYKIRLDRTVQV